MLIMSALIRNRKLSKEDFKFIFVTKDTAIELKS
jgi:hypothetical protein